MKSRIPVLTPLLRSDMQGDLLALLFLHGEGEFTLTDVTRLINAHPASVHREVERLVESGILSDRRVGRSRLIRVNPAHILHRPLHELLLLSYGPKAVLEPLLSEIGGADEAYIYGSWAARYAGETGPAPEDIDVLVVGTTSRSSLAELAGRAQEVLRREVNVTRVARDDWNSMVSPFVKTVRSRPLVALEVGADFT